jgi:hypothetical protein
MTRPPHLDDLVALATAANEDVKASAALISATDGSQFARRTFVRTVFAYVEAWITIQRLLLQESVQFGLISLSPAELALLRGDRYEITDSGSVRVTTDRVPSGDRVVRFLLATVASAYRLPSRTHFSGSGWQAFADSWKIRNRLTHPKAASHLHVSDADLQTVGEGHVWLMAAITRLTNDVTALLPHQLNRGV